MAENEGKGAKKREKAPKRSRVTKDMMFLAFALFMIFIVLFWVFSTSKPVDGNSGFDSKIDYTGNIQEFSESLYSAESIAIVANVTGIGANLSQYVYACGAGLAGSWGKLGKNISMLSIYVIEGEDCTFSSPKITGSQVSDATSLKSARECMEEVSSANLDPTHVSFYIQYGALYSIFNAKTAFIFVNEDFRDECSFRIPSSESTSVLTSAGSS